MEDGGMEEEVGRERGIVWLNSSHNYITLLISSASPCGFK